MILYISGPMSNLPDHNYPAFHAAAAFLRATGFDVLNPAEHFGGRRDLDREFYLRRDAEEILEADALVMLPNWEWAEGAKFEVVLAQGIGLPLLCYACLRWYIQDGRLRQEAIDNAETCACFSRNVTIMVGGESGYAAAQRGIPVDRTVPAGVPQTPMAPMTKASGEREQFDTGSVRDSRAGKGRYDLFSPWALARVAGVFERGAAHYGERNWEKGQPISRVLDSALRHVYQYMAGRTDEDHLAQASWNLLAALHFDELRPDLQDLPTRTHEKAA